MRIISVKLHNVFRFGTENNVVNFDELFLNGDSVAMISGATNGDENLSNGAGKSSIVEAIYWAFFECLPRIMDGGSGKRGVAVSEIVRKGDDGQIPDDVKESYVEVHFETRDNEQWMLKRGRAVKKSGKLAPIIELQNLTTGVFYSESSAVFEGKIAKIVKLNHQSFLNATIFAQNNAGRFLEGTDGERKDILMDLRGVCVIDDWLKVLRGDWKKTCESEITANDARIGVIRSNVDSMSPDMIRKDKMEKASQITAMERETATLEGGVKTAAGKRDEASVANDRANKDVEKAKEALNKVVEDGKSALVEAETKIRDTKNDVGAAEKKLADKRASSSVENLKKKLDETKKTIAELSEQALENELAGVESAKGEKAKAETEMETVNEKIGELKVKAAALKTAIEEKVARKNRIEVLKNGGGNDGQQVTCDKCGSVLSAEHLEMELRSVNKELADLESGKPGIDQEYVVLNAQLSKCKARQKDAATIMGTESRIRIDQERLKNAKSGLGTMEALYQSTVDSLRSLELEVTATQQRLTAANEAKAALVKRQEIERSVYRDDIANAEKLKSEADSAYSKACTAYDDAVKKVQEANSKCGALKSAIAVADEKLASIDRARAELDKFIEEGKVLSARLAKINYFDKLLSTRIKVKAAESCVPLIMHYANEFLSVLKSTARLQFGDEKGELSIRLIGATAPVYGLLSGGEKEAVRLAVNMALSMLTIGGMSEIPDMIFLDEVFAPLDVATKNNVFSLLTRLNKNFKRICVISHDQMIKERFDVSILVDKIDGISTITLN